MQRTVRAARLVLTPSQAAKDDIVRVLGLPPRRVRVIPEAAGPEYQPASDPLAPRRIIARFGIRGRYIFNVGGLDARKNLTTLLEAFARARPHLEEPTQLVIAGAAHTANPRVFPPLQPIIERLGVAHSVILTGRVTEEEKLALYQGASLYVTPSLYEGFGLTALEAMACGVPTIAANRTSLPEVVGSGGLLVEPEPEALAAAILSVLNHPERAAALREQGRARAAAFDWQRTARLTLDAYREALNPEKGPGDGRKASC
jgi:glycosyltransferase involved in cell wall biosynthesis